MPALESDADLWGAPPAARGPRLESDEDLWGAPPKRGGLIANLGAGTNEGTMRTLGAPVDIVTGALNLIPRGINAVAGTNLPTIENPVGGSEWLMDREKSLGVDPRDVAATTDAEKVARAGGAGAALMLLPGGVAKALPDMAGIAGAARSLLAEGSAPYQALIGIATGAGGQAAENAAPAPLKPYANLAGQIAGGGVAGLGEAGLRAAGTQVGGAARNVVAPLTGAGRSDLAAARVQGAASDPASAAAAIDANPREMVPGSTPTSYQLSGDRGLGSLEATAQTRDPEQFLARRAEQNAARIKALDDARIAPDVANPQSVTRAVRAAFDGMDGANALAESHAQNDFERARASEPVPQTAALDAARDEASKLGALPAGEDARETMLQRFGNAIRDPLEAARQTDKEARARVSAAVDPDGTLVVPTQSLREGAEQILAGQPRNARPLEGEPRAIFDLATELPGAQSFAEVAALRSRLTTAMREELSTNGRTPSYAMMSALLSRLHGALDPAITREAAGEAAAVRAGQLDPTTSMAARLAAWADGLRRDATQFQQTRAGRDNPAAAGNIPGVGQAARPGATGTAGTAGVGPGNPAGTAGLPGEQGLTPNWSEDAAARDRAAQAGWAEHFGMFRNAPGVGEVLRPGLTKDTFRAPSSQVPSLILGGKGAPERIQAFLEAGGDRQALLDFAAHDLRRSATDAEGALDPARARAWLAAQEKSGAADALPEMRTLGQDAIAARQSFDAATGVAKKAHAAEVSTAKDVFQRAQRQRVEDARAFQQSAAGKFLGDGDPVALVGQILRSKTAVSDMRRLVAMTSGSVSARMGLRRAVVESIQRDIKTDVLSGNGADTLIRNGQYQKIMRQAEPALAELFPPAQLDALKAVAADMQRATQSISGNRLPGRSNTAQDLAGLTKSALKTPSVLTQMAMAEGAGWAAGLPVIGSAVGLGSLALNVARKAGFQKVDDLITEACLQPDLMKALLLRPLPSGESGAMNVLKQRLRQTVVAASAGTVQRQTSMSRRSRDPGRITP